jgi:NAD(P)H-flavin reductase
MRKFPKMRLVSLCCLSVFLGLSCAFSPLSLPTTTLSSLSPDTRFSSTSQRVFRGTRLSAEDANGGSSSSSSSSGGAAKETPQYTKIGAVLRNVEKVSDGSFMLHMQVDDKHNNNIKLDYKPGHVVALEIQQDPSDDESELTADTIKNGGWMRGPYTVSRANTPSDGTLDVLIRVVGKKSATFANSVVNSPVRFGGKFKVPILDGVDQSETKKVVMISTGVGIGPCIGAIEMALQQQEQQQKHDADEYKNFPPIHLIASFRRDCDVVYREHLNALSQQNPTLFTWTPVITSETGRIAASKESVVHLISNSMRIQGLGLHDVHYHLIGNGQMVQEWQAGLKRAGVNVNQRVTLENYFNTRAQPDASAIDNIASAISSTCAAAVHACK